MEKTAPLLENLAQLCSVIQNTHDERDRTAALNEIDTLKWTFTKPQIYTEILYNSQSVELTYHCLQTVTRQFLDNWQADGVWSQTLDFFQKLLDCSIHRIVCASGTPVVRGDNINSLHFPKFLLNQLAFYAALLIKKQIGSSQIDQYRNNHNNQQLQSGDLLEIMCQFFTLAEYSLSKSSSASSSISQKAYLYLIFVYELIQQFSNCCTPPPQLTNRLVSPTVPLRNCFSFEENLLAKIHFQQTRLWPLFNSVVQLWSSNSDIYSVSPEFRLAFSRCIAEIFEWNFLDIEDESLEKLQEKFANPLFLLNIFLSQQQDNTDDDDDEENVDYSRQKGSKFNKLWTIMFLQNSGLYNALFSALFDSLAVSMAAQKTPSHLPACDTQMQLEATAIECSLYNLNTLDCLIKRDRYHIPSQSSENEEMLLADFWIAFFDHLNTSIHASCSGGATNWWSQILCDAHQSKQLTLLVSILVEAQKFLRVPNQIEHISSDCTNNENSADRSFICRTIKLCSNGNTNAKQSAIETKKTWKLRFESAICKLQALLEIVVQRLLIGGCECATSDESDVKLQWKMDRDVCLNRLLSPNQCTLLFAHLYQDELCRIRSEHQQEREQTNNLMSTLIGAEKIDSSQLIQRFFQSVITGQASSEFQQQAQYEWVAINAKENCLHVHQENVFIGLSRLKLEKHQKTEDFVSNFLIGYCLELFAGIRAANQAAIQQPQKQLQLEIAQWAMIASGYLIVPQYQDCLEDEELENGNHMITSCSLHQRVCQLFSEMTQMLREQNLTCSISVYEEKNDQLFATSLWLISRLLLKVDQMCLKSNEERALDKSICSSLQNNVIQFYQHEFLVKFLSDLSLLVQCVARTSSHTAVTRVATFQLLRLLLSSKSITSAISSSPQFFEFVQEFISLYPSAGNLLIHPECIPFYTKLFLEIFQFVVVNQQEFQQKSDISLADFFVYLTSPIAQLHQVATNTALIGGDIITDTQLCLALNFCCEIDKLDFRALQDGLANENKELRCILFEQALTYKQPQSAASENDEDEEGLKFEEVLYERFIQPWMEIAIRVKLRSTFEPPLIKLVISVCSNLANEFFDYIDKKYFCSFLELIYELIKIYAEFRTSVHPAPIDSQQDDAWILVPELDSLIHLLELCPHKTAFAFRGEVALTNQIGLVVLHSLWLLRDVAPLDRCGQESSLWCVIGRHCAALHTLVKFAPQQIATALDTQCSTLPSPSYSTSLSASSSSSTTQASEFLKALFAPVRIVLNSKTGAFHDLKVSALQTLADLVDHYCDAHHHDDDNKMLMATNQQQQERLRYRPIIAQLAIDLMTDVLACIASKQFEVKLLNTAGQTLSHVAATDWQYFGSSLERSLLSHDDATSTSSSTFISMTTFNAQHRRAVLDAANQFHVEIVRVCRDLTNQQQLCQRQMSKLINKKFQMIEPIGVAFVTRLLLESNSARHANQS